MSKLNLRRIVGMVGVVAMLGLVYAGALGSGGATIDCPAATANCVGTEFGDTINDHADTETIFGRAGDDTIVDNVNNSGPIERIFGGAGNDHITNSAANGHVHIFGEDGDDTFVLTNGVVRVEGGRGDDVFRIVTLDDPDEDRNLFVDGPGRDSFFDIDGTERIEIHLVGDNEPDTVILGDGGDPATIILNRNSGRDVINCRDSALDDGDVVMLNGNRKAVDTQGNNLRQAALLGGTAQSNCQTIIP